MGRYQQETSTEALQMRQLTITLFAHALPTTLTCSLTCTPTHTYNKPYTDKPAHIIMSKAPKSPLVASLTSAFEQNSLRPSMQPSRIQFAVQYNPSRFSSPEVCQVFRIPYKQYLLGPLVGKWYVKQSKLWTSTGSSIAFVLLLPASKV